MCVPESHLESLSSFETMRRRKNNTKKQLSKKGEKKVRVKLFHLSLFLTEEMDDLLSGACEPRYGVGNVNRCNFLHSTSYARALHLSIFSLLIFNLNECVLHNKRTQKPNQKKKNLFFYFHKFNFLLLFTAFVRRMRRECAEDTRTFTSSSSFFFDLVLSVIFGKNENASKEDKKHRIRFRANLLLCLAFNIFFRVLFVKLTGDDDDNETGNICRFLIISVRLRLEILLQQSEERRGKKVKEKGRKNLSLE